MSEIIEKGWLETRDGHKYAPKTVIGNIFTNEGKLYDDQVKSYISELKDEIRTEGCYLNSSETVSISWL